MSATHRPPAAGQSDPHHLQRFVDAQAPVYDQVVGELRRGRKTSHWMWFVFPQMRGLGRSSMAHTYGIASPDEAVAYAAHPLLGPRLRACTRLVVDAAAGGRSVHDIFGSPDDLKLLSCLSLFATVAPEPIYGDARRMLFGDQVDHKTIELLKTA